MCHIPLPWLVTDRTVKRMDSPDRWTINASSPDTGCPSSVPYAYPQRVAVDTVATTRMGSRIRISPSCATSQKFPPVTTLLAEPFFVSTRKPLLVFTHHCMSSEHIRSQSPSPNPTRTVRSNDRSAFGGLQLDTFNAVQPTFAYERCLVSRSTNSRLDTSGPSLGARSHPITPAVESQDACKHVSTHTHAQTEHRRATSRGAPPSRSHPHEIVPPMHPASSRMGQHVDQLPKGVSHVEPTHAPRLVGRPVFDRQSRSTHVFQHDVKIIDLH